MTQYMHSLPHYQHRSSEYFFPRDKPTLIHQSYPKSTVYFQFSSAAQSCLTLCDLVDCSPPGFPLPHHLPGFAKTHVIELVMPSTSSSCHPLLPLPSVFPSIRVFSNESALCMRWPKYWSFSISLSNEYSLG